MLKFCWVFKGFDDALDATKPTAMDDVKWALIKKKSGSTKLACYFFKYFKITSMSLTLKLFLRLEL